MSILPRLAMGRVEALIDRYGLGPLLGAIEEICYEKGDHLRTSWQDESSAKDWEKAGRRTGKLASTIGVSEYHVVLR